MNLTTQITEALIEAGLSIDGVNNKDNTEKGITVFLIDPTPEKEAQAAAIVASFFTPE